MTIAVVCFLIYNTSNGNPSEDRYSQKTSEEFPGFLLPFRHLVVGWLDAAWIFPGYGHQPG